MLKYIILYWHIYNTISHNYPFPSIATSLQMATVGRNMWDKRHISVNYFLFIVVQQLG